MSLSFSYWKLSFIGQISVPVFEGESLTLSLFPAQRGKGIFMENKLLPNSPVTSENHMGEPSPVSRLLNDQMKEKDNQAWEQSRFLYPLRISTAFFIYLNLFLVHSSNFHCHSSSLTSGETFMNDYLLNRRHLEIDYK